MDLFLDVAFLLIQFIQMESHSDFKGMYHLGFKGTESYKGRRGIGLLNFYREEESQE